MKWQPKKLTREQMAERRAEGVRLLQAGEMSQAQIARHLGVTEAAVSKWKKTLVTQGPEALKARKAPGRPPKLSAEQRTQLVNILQQGARAAGFPTEQWTLVRVKQVIKKHFEVDYHRNYLSRLLHGLGWSVQKPETRALERDEALIRAWLEQDWPRIKKAQQLGAQIVFEDEFGLSYTEQVTHTWAPVGQTPILTRHGRYRRETSTMGALTITGKIYKRHFDGAINAAKLVVGLKHSDILLGCFQHAGLELNQLW